MTDSAEMAVNLTVVSIATRESRADKLQCMVKERHLCSMPGEGSRVGSGRPAGQGSGQAGSVVGGKVAGAQSGEQRFQVCHARSLQRQLPPQPLRLRLDKFHYYFDRSTISKPKALGHTRRESAATSAGPTNVCSLL